MVGGQAQEQHAGGSRHEHGGDASEVDVREAHHPCSSRFEINTLNSHRQSIDARRPEEFQSRGAAIVGLAIAIACSVGSSAHAADPVHYLVRARIDPEEGTVAARMRVEVAVGAEEDHVRLWLYPDRLAVEPSAVDEISWRWIWPSDPELGGIAIERLEVDGAPVRGRREIARPGSPRGRDYMGADLIVPIEAGQARTVRIEIDFRLRVPDRFGRLGRARDQLSLAAPWYPLVVHDDDAWWLDATHRVGVEIAGGEAIVAGRMVGAGGTVDTRGPYVPVIAAEDLVVTELDGLRLVTTERPYRDPPAHAQGTAAIGDVVRIDVPRLAGESARDVDATLGALELDRADVAPAVVVVPTRAEFAANAPGMVLLSDRAFEVFPIEQTREFHRRAVRRALFAHQIAPRIAAIEPPADRPWSVELRAVLLMDLDDARRRGGTLSPQELLAFASWNPVVDQLLYAPQIPFEDVYFGTIEENDVFRDDPARSRRRIARGRRLLETARDALEEERFGEVGAALVAMRIPSRRAIGEGAVVDEWLDFPNREVNYRIVRAGSRRDGAGYVHRIEIERQGAERIEPVEVEVIDDDGRTLRGEWDGGDGTGSRGVVELRSRAPLDEVQLDPRSRLPQSPRVADGHPRRDDTTSLPWKPPLMRAFDLDLAASEGRIDGFIDFAMRRRFDLEQTFAATLYTNASAWGGSVRYIRSLGPKIDLNRRLGFLSAGISGQRLRDDFAGMGDMGIGGWSLGAGVGAGADTRRYFIDPRSGASLTGQLSVAGVFRDDDTFSLSLTGSIRGSFNVPIAWRHALVLIGGGGFVALEPLANELQPLGGRFLLRGYTANELLGRARAYGIAEYRFTAVTDRAWNVLHAGWIRELQLVVFAGAGAIFDPRASEDDFAGGAEIGGGVHLLFDYAGVQPGVLCLDVAVPERTLAGRPSNDPPLGVYVTFDQMF